MTLDEAIERYTSNAEYERTHGNLQGCLEFRQLAEWLKELKKNKDVYDSIRAEIDQYLFQNEFCSEYRKEVSQIIDKYKKESEE